MSDLYRSCWYALFLSVIKGIEADDSLRAMGVLKEGKIDQSK